MMNQFLKDYGHCCDACKYYDAMEGYCNKTNSYHYGYDFTEGDGEKCPHYKTADDLVEHRKKKPKGYEQLSLL